MEVGFVGTGNMGRPMAENLLKAGHRLTVFDARPQATAPLEAQGARRAADLPALAREVRVVLLSLPDEHVVERVLFGDGGTLGLIDGARPGDVVFDLSTVSPASTRRAAARAATHGITVVDAPVSGSVSGARAGTLAVMVGAGPELAAPHEPLFKAIGSSVFYLGERGRGNILKLLNNYIALGNQAVLCEALALADRLGVPRETVGEVVSRSSGASFILERKLPGLVARSYEPGFFVDLAHKDLTLALALCDETGSPSTMGHEACRLYWQASQAGHGRLDSSGLLRILEPGRPAPPPAASPTGP